MITVKLRPLPHFAGLPLPEYQSEQAAGLDLPAAVAEDVVLAPGKRAALPTGLSLELPPGWEAQVRPRSGLALRQGVTVLNSPGTVDADYRGEIKVILINLGEDDFVIQRGMRIAQLVVAPVTQARLEVSAELAASSRGSGGFGSTGL